MMKNLTTEKTKEYMPVIIEAADDKEFADLAASILAEKLAACDAPLTVLPTGNTPLGMYKILREEYKDREDLWSGFTYVSLDEYIGLDNDDDRLFHRWVGRELLDHLDIPAEQRMTFLSNAANPDLEAERMDSRLALNEPIDVAVVGLGTNGHIGFNEPGSAFDAPTRVVELTPETIATNAKYWGGEDRVPKTAFTLGLAELSKAQHTIMLVSGAHKAGILDATLNGPITEEVPATYLRTLQNVTIIADRAALL